MLHLWHLKITDLQRNVIKYKLLLLILQSATKHKFPQIRIEQMISITIVELLVYSGILYI